MVYSPWGHKESETTEETACMHTSGSDGKGSACNTGDLGLIPGSGRTPGEGNGNPLQYSCLENSMDRGAWWFTVHGVTKSWTQQQLTISLSVELSPLCLSHCPE